MNGIPKIPGRQTNRAAAHLGGIGLARRIGGADSNYGGIGLRTWAGRGQNHGEVDGESEFSGLDEQKRREPTHNTEGGAED